MSLLIAALVLFVAFHVLPGFGERAGWPVWIELGDALLDSPQSFFVEPKSAVAVACFLNFSMLIVASPFLTPVWRKSRFAWWFATISSGLAAVGFWGMFLGQGHIESVQSGGWCLLAAPLLNFYGLILARGNPAPTSPEPPF